MVKLPDIIDANDIFMTGDAEGMDKIASTVDDNVDIPFESNLRSLTTDKFACLIKTAEGTIRKFPVHTKESTELNINALMYTHEKLPDEVVKVAACNLIKAAQNWGISDKATGLRKMACNCKTNFVNLDRIDENKYLNKIDKTEHLAPEVFALGEKYPIDTPELMKQAEIYFKQYSDKLDPLEKYEYSTNMIKQAKKLSYEISTPGIMKYAHLSLERNPDMEHFLRARDKKAHTEGAYTEIAKVASRLPLEKIAEAVYELDSEFGLNKYYDRVVPDPIFTVFSCIEKTAANINGHEISLENLRTVPSEKLKSLSLTDDAIAELHSDNGLQVLTSLPEPVVDEIVNLM